MISGAQRQWPGAEKLPKSWAWVRACGGRGVCTPGVNMKLAMLTRGLQQAVTLIFSTWCLVQQYVCLTMWVIWEAVKRQGRYGKFLKTWQSLPSQQQHFMTVLFSSQTSDALFSSAQGCFVCVLCEASWCSVQGFSSVSRLLHKSTEWPCWSCRKIKM